MDNNIENIESGQSKGGIMGLERKDLAVERKHRIGCNCCQAVLLAFADKIKECWSSRKAAECVAAGGVSAGDEIFLKALGSGFGSGMGGMDATCGALVGAGMVLGLLDGNADIEAGDKAKIDGSETLPTKLTSVKMPTALKARNLSAEFKEKVGALRCADIKGIHIHPQTGNVVRGQVLCSCDDCVRHAVQIAQKFLDSDR
ncbi:MAG: C_GCAxxG_C_C family protein [Bacteroidales bacterium]|nr:C_GCAxxG_C_C family protein [Bacteroidales bacterium]